MNTRVLVLSHNAFSRTQNNGKTLESFFAKWDSDCLAQIYLQPEQPDFSFCKKYYCMSDYEVLNQYVAKGKIGKIVTPEKDNFQKENLGVSVGKLYDQKTRQRGNRKGLNAYIHRKFVERKPAFVFAREIMWKYAHWDTDELYSWISAFTPNVLFFQGSSGSFAYVIASTICKRFGLPLILELTDDYTYYQNKYSIIEHINKRWYLRSLKDGISTAKTTITISSYMAQEYLRRFGGNYEVLLNSISDPKIPAKIHKQNLTLLFAGNISLNRWKTLLTIGLTLDHINATESTRHAELRIYTPTSVDNKTIRKIGQAASILYGGSLNAQELKEAIESADYLVHVESFDKKMKKATRLSISTKIPEYLASNRCIFAVGPKDIASMKYLQENQAAVVCNSEQMQFVEETLLKLFNNPLLSASCISNAQALYTRYHRSEESCKNIEQIINNATV